MKTIRDWKISLMKFLLFIPIIWIFLDTYDASMTEEDLNMSLSILAFFSLIILYSIFNSKVKIDFDNDTLSYPFLFLSLFRRKVKISQIDTFDLEENINETVNDHGKTTKSKSYKVRIYGEFGDRSIKFASKGAAHSLISSLKNGK